MHTMISSALAALALPISFATLGAGGYLACYMEYTGKDSASCFIASIGANYSCALTRGAPRCFTAQEEELHCLYGLNRPGELPEVSCIAAIPRATPPKAIHVVIDDARFGGPGKAPTLARRVEPATMLSRARLSPARQADAPARSIPTIGDLMRPPPPPPVTQQDVEDALDAAAEGAAAAKEAAAAANTAANAAAQAAQAAQQQELQCRPDYIGGVVCRPR